MKKSALFLFTLTLLQFATAQKQQDINDYIQRYKDVALEEMVRCGIPASITLAQGIHESNCGHSPLSREANNHFGIKCKEEWTGKTYYMDDDKPNECFRVYQHAEASYADHSDFLVTRPRYADLFKLSITDYKGWANGLKSCGYATNPKYAQILISKIEEYHLYDYDRQGIAMIAEKGKLMAFSGTQAPAAKSTPVVPKANTTTPAPVVPQVTTVTYKEQQPREVEQKHTIFETPNREPDRRQFEVNGLHVLIAMANEDPLKIALDYDVDYSVLLQYNDMEEGERFKAGENIFLEAKKNKGANTKYTVKAGESMRDISQNTGVKLRELCTKNLVKGNEQVYAGENISLQDKMNSAPRTMPYADFLKAQTMVNTTPTVNNSKTEVARTTAASIAFNRNEYQVQPSDTLYSIAKKFNLSVQELQSMNNLPSAQVQAGQKLVVSK